MNAVERAAATGLELDHLAFDERTVSLLERRAIHGEGRKASRKVARRRGWLVRRALLAADVGGLVTAFLLARLLAGHHTGSPTMTGFAVLLLTIPVWVVAAQLYGLYERDEEHVDHSTVDEVVGVFHLVTLGAWLSFVGVWLAGVTDPYVLRLVAFWFLAVILVAAFRGLARSAARRSSLYLQNTIIIGAGHIGQLAARKLLQHPEYGINLVGFVDEHPRERRPELDHLALLGRPDRLDDIVTLLDVERVIVAFSRRATRSCWRRSASSGSSTSRSTSSHACSRSSARRPGIHAFEGLPLVGLPPAKLSRSSRLLKRTLDFVGALAMLLAPGAGHRC